MYQILVLFPLATAVGQRVGREQYERHPSLAWKRCDTNNTCETVNGEIVLDADWRWLHQNAGYLSCYEYGLWNEKMYDYEDPDPNLTYAKECSIEGADYERTYGITARNDSVTLKYRTNADFAHNLNSRIYLLEATKKYQMFTLLGNELAFDVDLSTVDCGLNSALYFVAMDPDGGMAKYPTNEAGAEYGTGYCDSSCPRSLRFIGGKANVEGWIPSATDPVSGEGIMGACCPEIAVW
ncbi:hypothetical protein jhhlp_004789 [Lomentospora prolificans]|uniref:Glucanase n=1 Tax=Lomentospora prolificans TaxID=41688 RepID=A0A2N3N8F7_9PEZI|nr:hypothetical protein jhhlp_004789 [Lomentospora prolificans]